MKIKMLLAAILAANILNTAVLANSNNKQVDSKQTMSLSKKILMAKLAKLNFFSANFNQQVVDVSGETIQQTQGKLAISKPNSLYWETFAPDELFIIADGKTAWFYNPWIEQASAYSLSAAIAKTPILLLTSQDESLWQQYNITQTAQESSNTNSFVISAIDTNSQIKSLTLTFTVDETNDHLSQFSFLDATGQLSHIKLSQFESETEPDSNLFNFIVPEGVTVEDHREQAQQTNTTTTTNAQK
ncbi:MAG: outer membrane lipoprotein chaperone LolA [Colwellia sp.]